MFKITMYIALIFSTSWWGFSFYGAQFWWADLLSNFALQFTLVYVIFAIIFIIFRNYIGAIIAIIIALYMGITSFCPLYKANDSTVCNGEYITITQYNLLYSNNNINNVIRWFLEENDSDIIMLQEVDDTWRDKMNILALKFPYHLGVEEDSPAGLAIYSKIPLQSAEFLEGSLGRSTYARIEILTPENKTPVTLYNIHAVSPTTKSNWYMRNFNLLDVAYQISHDRAENIIAAGDFNTTRWSYWFEKFVEISGLSDAQEGFGYEVSWSPVAAKTLIAGLHIDQMLISDNIQVTSRSFAPDLGSDHLPVVTEACL